jgi:hypothetical protein
MYIVINGLLAASVRKRSGEESTVDRIAAGLMRSFSAGLISLGCFMSRRRDQH